MSDMSKTDPKMKQMKTDYESIPIPKDLKHKVTDTMMKAKRENEAQKKYTNLFTFVKYTGATAAAAVLGITIMANSGASVAHAMEQIPVIGAITKVVTFRTYNAKSEDGKKEASIETPKLKGNGKAEQALNKQLQAYTSQIKKQFERDMKNKKIKVESVNTTYNVLTDTKDYFSMQINTTVSQASTDSFNKFYTVDKKTGAILTLKSLFKDGSDYITPVSKEILRQMKAANKKEAVYFAGMSKDDPAYDSEFKAIRPDQNFYLNQNGDLVIAFDKYEVAPGVYGTPSFVIPNTVISEMRLSK